MSKSEPINLELTTERLHLKPLALEDVDLAIEMFTDPEVVKYMGGTMSEDKIRRDMATWVKRGGNGCIGIWTISDHATAEKYGDVFLLPIPEEEDDTDWDLVVPGKMPEGDVEVGYALKRSAWGKGIATEVCRRLIRLAFEETPLDEVVSTIEDEHVRSRNVLEKSGLTYRGRRRAYGEDSPDFRISRTEWTRLNRNEQNSK